MRSTPFMSLSLLLLFPAMPAVYGADVCCIMAKTEGEIVETAAMVADELNCEKGKEAGGNFVVCSHFEDPENLCPMTALGEQCAMCGYHWQDTVCMLQDPVEKAKKELKEEAEKEKANKAAQEAKNKEKKKEEKAPPAKK